MVEMTAVRKGCHHIQCNTVVGDIIMFLVQFVRFVFTKQCLVSPSSVFGWYYKYAVLIISVYVCARSRAVPEEVISSWLRELYLQNKRYESLISSGDDDDEPLSTNYIALRISY